MRTRFIERKFTPIPRSPEAALLDARKIMEELKRLDGCAACLTKNADRIGDELAHDIGKQLFVYTSFLLDCRQHGIALTDPRIREAYKELCKFCEFLESEFRDE